MMRNIFAPSLKSAALSCTALVAITAIIANPTDAQAQVAEVVITGSLIGGAPPVGVPVMSLGAEEFLETGTVTISEMLERLPQIYTFATLGQTATGGNFSRNQSIDIHGLNGFDGRIARTLMLFDGMRFPLQGHAASTYDPSIIPALAVDRIDVLADGASSTYGSDAVAGVVNVILKRRYEGQFSQVRIGTTNSGGENYQASHLYGRAWDTGDITIVVEHYKTDSIAARNVDGYTYDFRPWGLDDTTPIASAVPAIISRGGPNVPIGAGCTNCFSLPAGLGNNYFDRPDSVTLGGDPAPTTSWDAILGNQNIANARDPYLLGDISPQIEKTSATITFDQQITENVELFLDGIYSLRHHLFTWPPGIRAFNTTIFGLSGAGPTFLPSVADSGNPYLPSGTRPGGPPISVNYNFGYELQPYNSAREMSMRVGGGFNIELPYDWFGKITAATNNSRAQVSRYNFVNPNHFLAALGATVGPFDSPFPGAPGIDAYTKPDNIPFLNLFCDPTAFQCNDPRTLEYIAGVANNIVEKNRVDQLSANFDGPLFELPGGEVSAAVGATYYKEQLTAATVQTRRSASKSLPSTEREHLGREIYAFYGQVIVPLIGEQNDVPLFNRLVVEASYRLDHYDAFGYAKNPKFGVTWSPFPGLDFRGSWSKAFRSPSMSNFASTTGRGATTSPEAVAGICPDGGTANPGSATFDLNPTCDQSGALNNPVALFFLGNAGGPVVPLLRPGEAGLSPETARSWSFGFDFEPTWDLVAGLNLSFTLYNVDITNTIASIQNPGINDPNFRNFYIVRGIDMPDAQFNELATAIITIPVSQVTDINPLDVTLISDGVVRNLGSEEQRGIDFDFSYGRDIGNMGFFDIGISGNWKIHDILDPGGDIFNNSFGLGTQPKRINRARLGWTDGSINATLFWNHLGHFHSNQNPPSATQFPNYPVAAGGFQFVDDFDTFDFALGYNTNDMFPNMPHLNNINIQFVANNAFNTDPPFVYSAGISGNGSRAFDGRFHNPYGRRVSLTISKEW